LVFGSISGLVPYVIMHFGPGDRMSKPFALATDSCLPTPVFTSLASSRVGHLSFHVVHQPSRLQELLHEGRHRLRMIGFLP